MEVSARSHQWTVVVVDDDLEMRQLLSRLVASAEQFNVVAQAEDGLSAIEIVRKEQPDLVLLDCQMPGVDGLAALPEIRRTAPDAVVVMVSGSPSAEIASLAAAKGADCFYVKTPGLVQHLVDDLSDLLVTRTASSRGGSTPHAAPA